MLLEMAVEEVRWIMWKSERSGFEVLVVRNEVVWNFCNGWVMGSAVYGLLCYLTMWSCLKHFLSIWFCINHQFAVGLLKICSKSSSNVSIDTIISNFLWDENPQFYLLEVSEIPIFIEWYRIRQSAGKLRLIVWRFMRESLLHMTRWRGWSSPMLWSKFYTFELSFDDNIESGFFYI